MEEMFAEFEFSSPTDCGITQVNGLELQKDYLDFMHAHNGGEGAVGENAYLQLVPLEDLEQFNCEYKIAECTNGIYIFGTDLGGTLFGYSVPKGLYCAIDACSITEEDIFYAGENFEGFIIAMDEGEL